MRHFVFEIKKLLFTKKFLIALCFIIAAISLLFIRNYTFQDYAAEIERKEIQRIVKFHRDVDYTLSYYLRENDGDKIAIEKLARNEEVLQKALVWSTTYNRQEDWSSILEKENAYLHSLQVLIDAEDEIPLTMEEIKDRLMFNEELLARNISPEYEDYSIALPNFMKQIIDFIVMYGALVIILILISDLLSGEFESRTLLFQFSQPLKRSNIIFSKFFSAIIMYILVLGTVLVTTFALPTFFGEKGDFNYPVFIEVSNGIHPISISDYVQSAIIANFVFALLIIALYLLFSLITKHTLLTLVSVTSIALAGAMLAMFIKGKLIALLNPFRYLLSMEFITIQNNQNWYDSIIVSLLLTIIFVVISNQIIKTSKVE